MEGWIYGVGIVNNYLRIFVLQIMYVIEFSDYSTTSAGYFTKVSVPLFEDRPKMAVVLDLDT
jgi:hypothetical protein